MRRLWLPASIAAIAFACASGETIDDPPLQVGVSQDASSPIDTGTPPISNDAGPRDATGGADARRDVGTLPDVIPTDSALADVVFVPDATGGPADCPTANQVDFLFYYLAALNELSGPNPESCPCANTALRCCFAGLVCVDR